jgi:hypothetical protein
VKVSDDRKALKAYGLLPGKHKLNPMEREKIADEYTKKRSINSLAKQYKVDRQTIRRILRNKGVYQEIR